MPIDKSIGELRPLGTFFSRMRKRKNTLNAAQIKAELRNWFAFEGPLGEVVYNVRYFFAWKEGHLMGTYSTLKEATESLAPRERPETKREMRRWPSLLLPNTD